MNAHVSRLCYPIGHVTVEQFEGTEARKRTKLGVTVTCLCCWTKSFLWNIDIWLYYFVSHFIDHYLKSVEWDSYSL